MPQINVHVGTPDDVDAAVSVYERSNLARRHGDWPSRSSRIAEVRASLSRSKSVIDGVQREHESHGPLRSDAQAHG